MQIAGRQTSEAGAEVPHGPARRDGRAWAVVVAGIGLVAVIAAACAQASVGQQGPADTKSKQAASGLEGNPGPALAVSSASQEAKLFCYVETLTADRPSIYGYMAPRGCVISGTFKRGERMVWRFEVLDVSKGAMVTSEEAESVTLRLPYGVEEKAIYKQRGDGQTPGAPWTWEVCWDVPLDYPIGSLDYSIFVVFKDGRQGEWKPSALVDPSRGVDSRPQIIP